MNMTHGELNAIEFLQGLGYVVHGPKKPHIEPSAPVMDPNHREKYCYAYPEHGPVVEEKYNQNEVLDRLFRDTCRIFKDRLSAEKRILEDPHWRTLKFEDLSDTLFLAFGQPAPTSDNYAFFVEVFEAIKQTHFPDVDEK